MLAIEDYVLPEEGFKRISKQLYSVSTVYRYFTAERTLVYPNLYNIIKSLDFDFAIAKEIDKVLDSDGNIRPDASPELGRIRRSMQFKMKELDKVFRQIIQDYRGKGFRLFTYINKLFISLFKKINHKNKMILLQIRSMTGKLYDLDSINSETRDIWAHYLM